jgi:6-phosphogluconate dehydrogenase
MQVAMIGLGTMGGGMVRRLVAGGHEVVGIDLNPAARDAAAASGATTSGRLEDLARWTAVPRVVWVMLGAGEPTSTTLAALADLLEPGDLVVDGGNSDFRDAATHQERLSCNGIRFVDVGVSGGQWGYRSGYGLMVGGSAQDVADLQPVLDSLAGGDGSSRVGEVGAGHLVKAIHNGVQYAVLQAYAEGYALLARHAGLDALAALRAWQGGSSVRSYLLEQVIAALEQNPTLDGVTTLVPDSGMGRWTAEEAIRLAVPTPILTAALHARFASRDDGAANRLLAAARDQIGGKA